MRIVAGFLAALFFAGVTLPAAEAATASRNAQGVVTYSGSISPAVKAAFENNPDCGPALQAALAALVQANPALATDIVAVAAGVRLPGAPQNVTPCQIAAIGPALAAAQANLAAGGNTAGAAAIGNAVGLAPVGVQNSFAAAGGTSGSGSGNGSNGDGNGDGSGSGGGNGNGGGGGNGIGGGGGGSGSCQGTSCN